MRKLWSFLIVSCITTCFCMVECTKENDREFAPLACIDFDTITFTHSMKGWEIYSWPNAKEWNFSILPGTNRLKSYTEVTGNAIAVTGVDSLKRLLEKIPENEFLFLIGEEWLERCWGGNYGDLSLPDKETIREIKLFCEQHNLILAVSE